jgi:hypothetical protein
MPKLTTLSLKSHSTRILVLSFLFLTLSFNKIQGQTHSFSGTIGKYPIYLQMTLEGSTVEGHYFYKNKLIDIPLKGTFKYGLITVNTTDVFGDTPENPETFKFKWPNKTPVGTWTHKGKALDLKLFPLTPKETGSSKCTNPYFKKEISAASDLTKVKLGLFKLKEDGPPRIINKLKIRQFTEVLTGISLFRIDSGLVTEKQKDANFYLEYLQLSEFLSSLECASFSTYGSDYSFSVSNISLSGDLISFSVFVAYYCGGAHPEENNYGVNYDLSTHQKIESSDYLLPGKEKAFENRVFDYLSKTYPGYFSSESPEDDLECEYFKPELWTVDCNFSFTDEGIKLLPSFAHYMAPCLDPEWAVIPYSELKDLIKPEYYNKLKQLKP